MLAGDKPCIQSTVHQFGSDIVTPCAHKILTCHALHMTLQSLPYHGNMSSNGRRIKSLSILHFVTFIIRFVIKLALQGQMCKDVLLTELDRFKIKLLTVSHDKSFLWPVKHEH